MLDYRKIELRVTATRTVATTQNVVGFIEGSVEPGSQRLLDTRRDNNFTQYITIISRFFVDYWRFE